MDSDLPLNIQSSDKASDPLLKKRDKNFFKRTKQSTGKTLPVCCMITLCIALVILVCSIPTIQIVMGSLYKDSCPMNPLIPIYLIVIGATKLTLFIITIIKIIVEKSSFLTFLQILLFLFCLSWFITGNIWIYKAKRTVQYYYPDHPHTYCHYSVFNCAYGTLFIGYGFVFSTIYYGSKRST